MKNINCNDFLKEHKAHITSGRYHHNKDTNLTISESNVISFEDEPITKENYVKVKSLILDNISPVEDGCDIMVLACLSDKGDCYLKIIEVYFEDTKRNRAN